MPGGHSVGPGDSAVSATGISVGGELDGCCTGFSTAAGAGSSPQPSSSSSRVRRAMVLGQDPSHAVPLLSGSPESVPMLGHEASA